jgi:hypothetical protein
MRIRGHGNAVAIALAGLAVVLAATGTAYAVTATTVHIADPKTRSDIARVDTSGRLTTVGASSSLDIAAFAVASSGAVDVFSSPTKATLAVTKFSVIAQQPQSATYGVYFYQVPVKGDGSCSTTATTRLLGFGMVYPGQTGGQDYPAPLLVKAAAGARYCLDVYIEARSGTSASTDSFGVQIAGYVAAGTYSGTGLPSATTRAAVLHGRKGGGH